MNVPAPIVAMDNSKRSVLLVDIHSRTRDSRAQTMRKLGATVDCASSVNSGITQFASGLYRLVLIDLGRDVVGAEQFARVIRHKNPKQLIGFLVAGPALIVKTLAKPMSPTLVASQTPRVPLGLSQATEASDFGRKVREIEQQRDRADQELQKG